MCVQAVTCIMEHILYGILLENVNGYKKDAVDVYTEVFISKGSMLQTLLTHDELLETFTNPPHNYEILTDSTVTLCCNCDQVHQLTTVQKDLLCGIQDLSDRLGAVHKLGWAVSLEIESVVYVSLPSSKSPQKATVQYIGKVKGLVGKRFGLKLMVSMVYVLSINLFDYTFCPI